MRALVLLSAVLLLSGCSAADRAYLLRYPGHATPSARTVAAAPAPTPPAPMPQPVRAPVATPPANAFCQNVARQDSQSDDFDAATQARVFARAYQQCVAVHGAAP